MDAATAGEVFDEIGVKELRIMLQAGLAGLQEIVDAQVGDKTLVDTLSPAVDMLKMAEDSGLDMNTALEQMKQAARTGRDSTKNMVAKFGRSSRLGERSRGVLDAGATSCCIILESMADAMLKLL